MQVGPSWNLAGSILEGLRTSPTLALGLGGGLVLNCAVFAFCHLLSELLS